MDEKFRNASESWLTTDYRPLKIEEEILNFWKSNKIPDKLRALREKMNKGDLGWVEGPPTLNGVPHVGHARGRVIKDLRYRFKTLQGYNVPFWAGWDTQGLPVELEAEKQLGVKNKKELLERVGEERFVEECRKIVEKYYVYWRRADERLGLFIDNERTYWTYTDDYIEREWQYLKSAWDQDLLGEGYYVVAYCPSCQTSLSNAEVGLGYEEVEDPSVYFKLKVKDKEAEYFLVWTTMPFTIVTDIMLAVHPEATYSRVKVGDEVWIMAEGRVDPVMDELGVGSYERLGKIIGKDIEGEKYVYPFLDLVPEQKKMEVNPLVHSVFAEDFVDVETATGIVHLSPGSGEEDFLVAEKRGVPVFVPYDSEVRFTDEAGEFSGIFARDADEKVIEELRRRGLLVKSSIIRHEYPTCWRSHHKLIWLAKKEYYIWTDRINDRILKAAEGAEYYFEGVRNRFLSFLKEGKPWCISRERLWGTPLPIWICEECGNKTLISSKKELVERSIERPIGYFELHKPWIDQFILECEECGGKMKRVPFVIDVWFDSGAAPYARFSEEEFRRFMPMDFLVEAIDQTRGWANSILLEHVILTRCAESPFRSFLFCGFALDDQGRKMSKSLGNVIEVNSLLDRYSADLTRYYLLSKTSPVESMNFDVKELMKRPYQILGTLYHLHRFFLQNAEYDNFDPSQSGVQWALREDLLEPPDRWLLSKLQGTIENYTEKLDSCEFHLAYSLLDEFIINILSRNYIPMIRRDLWSDAPEFLKRRWVIYSVLWETLHTLLVLLNPASPYISEFLYQKVFRKLNPELPETVHFEGWPEGKDELKDAELEEKFDFLIRCVSLVNSARQISGMKRRWPLKRVYLVTTPNVADSIRDLEDVFLELVNVKEVLYPKDKVEIEPEELERCSHSIEGEIEIFLYTHRDASLLGEGLMRDLARRVQALRKELGYVPTDILDSVYISDLTEEEVEMLKLYREEMLNLVRAKDIHISERKIEIGEEWHRSKLDDRVIHIALK